MHFTKFLPVTLKLIPAFSSVDVEAEKGISDAEANPWDVVTLLGWIPPVAKTGVNFTDLIL